MPSKIVASLLSIENSVMDTRQIKRISVLILFYRLLKDIWLNFCYFERRENYELT